MIWPFRPKPILPFPVAPIVQQEPKPIPKLEPGIVVEEESWPEGDVEAMSRTGQFKAWVSSKVKGP